MPVNPATSALVGEDLGEGHVGPPARPPGFVPARAVVCDPRLEVVPAVVARVADRE